MVEFCTYFSSGFIIQQHVVHPVSAFSLNPSQQDIAICLPKSTALVSITARGSINKDQPNSLQDVTEHKLSYSH